MNTRKDPQRPQEELIAPTHAETIQPTEFDPVDPDSLAKKLWLRPATAGFGLVILVMAALLWYVFSARSVYLSFSPEPDSLSLRGGWSFKVGERYLLREGDYELKARLEGYYPLQTRLQIGSEQNQSFEFELKKLPGLFSVVSTPDNAKVLIDGEEVGATPAIDIEVPAGERKIEVLAERYLPEQKTLQIEGRKVKQRLELTLTPAWSDYSVSSSPAGADIYVDGDLRGQTPAQLEVMQGEREISLQLVGYKSWRTRIQVEPDQIQSLPRVELLPVDGLVQVNTVPGKANVTVNDEFRGQTPLALELEPDRNYRISLFKSGYQRATRSVTVESGVEQRLDIKLSPVLAEIQVSGQPANARVYADGVLLGGINKTYKLPIQRQKLEVRLAGHVPYETWVTPRQGIAQQVAVRLKTLEQAKWEAIDRVIKSPAGQRLNLYRPNGYLTMGASRREAGRRANEILRKVELTRAFYLAEKEVTNEQYRLFNDSWSSGHVKGNSLNGDAQPVVNISWQQAALYCNWLSEQASLSPFYEIEAGKVVGFDTRATGYRLPTEAEWAWAARKSENGELKYPWGPKLPPDDLSGNYADRSAAFVVGRVVQQYHDNYAVTAPVGSFSPNQHGLYDMGGNAAEWINDYYGTPAGLSQKVARDPTGPESGRYHVIKGSSWAHGTVTQLRLSYRDYGDKGRNDVGFRVARYVE